MPSEARPLEASPGRSRLKTRHSSGLVFVAALSLAIPIGEARSARAADAAAYPDMRPIEQYRIASPSDEIALARSAAPAALSNDAEVLILGEHGYETAKAGRNGFVCLVERSWTNDFADPEFWNPKIRSPICHNPASARSVLPAYLKRTTWILAGLPKSEMVDRTRAATASGEIAPPLIGAMGFMMSKGGYLGDSAGGHWRPHLMFFLPRTSPAAWGANLPGVPLVGADGGIEPLTVFFAPVPQWSDGSPGPGEMRM